MLLTVSSTRNYEQIWARSLYMAWQRLSRLISYGTLIQHQTNFLTFLCWFVSTFASQRLEFVACQFPNILADDSHVRLVGYGSVALSQMRSGCAIYTPTSSEWTQITCSLSVLDSQCKLLLALSLGDVQSPIFFGMHAFLQKILSAAGDGKEREVRIVYLRGVEREAQTVYFNVYDW